MKTVLALLASTLLICPFWAHGQELPAKQLDFSHLRNERAQIISEIDNLKNDMRRKENDALRISTTVQDVENYVRNTKQNIENITNQLKTEKNPDVRKRLETDLRFNQQGVARGQSDLDQRMRLDKELEDARTQMKNKEKVLFEVEAQINDLLARDVVAQKFKSQISLYFAMVVGLMILCFFGVAFYDEKVRITIFSGQAGIQFVTLFSLIIAIILFGITGILGDKELAALLGGLSGYILGRYNGPDVGEATAKPKGADG